MFPKIGPTGSRFLEPVKAPERPGDSLNSGKAAKGDEGGYGTLNYAQEDALHKEDGSNPDQKKKDSEEEEVPAEKVSALAFQPGLTQVILDFSAPRKRYVSGEALHQYEADAKENKDPELTLGSKLDQKAS